MGVISDALYVRLREMEQKHNGANESSFTATQLQLQQELTQLQTDLHELMQQTDELIDELN